MPLSPAFRSLRLAPLALALGLLAACATTGASKAPPSVKRLYTQLDQASQGYETALQQARAGDKAASEKSITQALDELRDASAHCSAAQGCDPQRFFSVFDHLLRLKDGSFIGDESPDDQDNASPSGQVIGLNGAASLPQAQRSVILLHGQKLSELVAMNGPVRAALQMWLTQWRPNLVNAYVNYQYLRHEMWPAYKKADLPEALLFGILAVESGGKVDAVSSAGAAGPLQFMYATGLRFGLGMVDGFDTRFDPADAARANAAYMNEELKVFNDNLELAIGAYNGGEGRMSRLVGNDTSISFYDPRVYDQLPQETRDYVPSVLAAAWLFLHPESYNLYFPHVDGAPGSITLQQPASLSELTVCLGQAGGMEDGWFRTLRNLNPQLDPQQELPKGTVLQVPRLLEKPYASRCVIGPWPILANYLHDAVVPVVPVRHDPPPQSREELYRVRRGDTVIGIAHRHGCKDVGEIERMNHIYHARIRIGQVLRLPACRR